MDVMYTALAHQPPMPQNVWQAWNWDPFLLLGLLLAGILYARGVARLWRQAGTGRAVSVAQVWAFGAGMLALVVALVSPLDALAEALLSAHMVQHLLLMLVAAPLLVAGLPPVALAWTVPRSKQVARWWHRRSGLRRVWYLLSGPGVIWSVHILVLWLWHVPRLYEAALLDETVHVVEHAAFLGAALLFWWTLWRERALAAGAGALYVFTTMLLSGLLGVLLTFSQSVWYPAYGIAPFGWGLSPLQDQQLAGAIMWFPGSLIYLAATLLLLGLALQRRAVAEGDAKVVVAPRQRLEAKS